MKQVENFIHIHHMKFMIAGLNKTSQEYIRWMCNQDFSTLKTILNNTRKEHGEYRRSHKNSKRQVISSMVGNKLFRDLDSLKEGVSDLILIAEHGEMSLLRTQIETMIERALIFGYTHGQTGYSVWSTEFSGK